MNFPVVDEQALTAVKRGWLSRRRQLSEIPRLPPGAVYVFQSGGGYHQHSGGNALDLSHPDIVDASFVSLVDTRVRLVDVERSVPSESAADVFTIRATFTCQVTDPVEVTRHGVTDVTMPLRAYLAGDTELSRVGVSHSVEDVNTVRDKVTHRMLAYSAIVAPRISGMAVEYVGNEVLTPDDLRTFQEQVRNEAWGREIKRAQRVTERDDVLDRAELLAQGPAVIEALKLVRDPAALTEIVDRLRRLRDDDTAHERGVETTREQHTSVKDSEERALHARLLVTLIERLTNAEMSYVDATEVLRQLLEKGGSPTATEASRMLAAGVGAGEERKTGNQGDRPEDGFYTDEDELL